MAIRDKLDYKQTVDERNLPIREGNANQVGGASTVEIVADDINGFLIGIYILAGEASATLHFTDADDANITAPVVIPGSGNKIDAETSRFIPILAPFNNGLKVVPGGATNLKWYAMVSKFSKAEV